MAGFEPIGSHLPRPPRKTATLIDSPRSTSSPEPDVPTTRPADCWCNGRGGEEIRFVPDGEGGGIPVFARCCGCPEGRAEQAKKDLETTAYHMRLATARAKKHFELACVPEMFARCRFSTFPATSDSARAAIEALRAWAEKGGDGARESVLLYGDYGVGKTGLAVAAMREATTLRKLAALFVATPDLLDKIRATYSAGYSDATANALIQSVKEIPLLVLDDLGAERPSDWVREKLFTIVNHRHDHCLPTIFTSNLSPRQLAGHVGERTAWRIVEMSTVLHVEGPNLRSSHPARLPYAED